MYIFLEKSRVSLTIYEILQSIWHNHVKTFSPSSLRGTILREFIHLPNSLEVLQGSLHGTRTSAGAENLTLFAKSKLPESADAAFKDGIPAPRSDGEALEWFEWERARERVNAGLLTADSSLNTHEGL